MEHTTTIRSLDLFMITHREHYEAFYHNPWRTLYGLDFTTSSTSHTVSIMSAAVTMMVILTVRPTHVQLYSHRVQAPIAHPPLHLLVTFESSTGKK